MSSSSSPSPVTRRLRLLRHWAPLLLIAALMFSLAAASRLGLVEPPVLSATCDHAPADEPVRCTLRSLVIQAFVNHRLAWAAWLLALLAWLPGRQRWALPATACGSAGLVLYSAGSAAPALLLAGLAWGRGSR